MRRIVWTREARENLAAIRAYIGEFNPLAAHRVAVTLITAGESLVLFPERGRRGPGYRELTVVAPYVIRYRLEENSVHILWIRHGAMNRS